MKNILLAGICCLLLTGCMSFNNAELPKVKPPENPKTKPTIEIKVGDFTQRLNGEGTSRGIISNNALGYSIFLGLLGRWQSKGLIAYFASTGNLGESEPDYTLTLNGYRNEDMSPIGSFITGLTLFIIPSSTTMEFDLNFELKNNKTNKVYLVHAKNSSTTWMEILFIIGFPVFWVGNDNMFEDTAMYIYSKFYEQGAFKEFYQ